MSRRRKLTVDQEYLDGWRDGYAAALKAATDSNALDLDYFAGVVSGFARLVGFPAPAAAAALKERRVLQFAGRWRGVPAWWRHIPAENLRPDGTPRPEDPGSAP